MRTLAPPPLSRLVASVERVGKVAAPLVIVAVLTWGWPRLRPQWRSDEGVWALVASAWFAGVSAAVLAQQWWSYQMLAVLVPLGLMASSGLDRLLQDRRTLVVAGLLPLLFGVRTHLDYGRAVLQHGRDQAAIERDLSPTTAEHDQLHAYLDAPGRLPGEVYVFGDPLLTWGIGRPQSVAIHGWSPEFYCSVAWWRLQSELSADRPVYVVVDHPGDPVPNDRAAHLNTWLAKNYQRVAVLPSGVQVLQEIQPGSVA